MTMPYTINKKIIFVYVNLKIYNMQGNINIQTALSALILTAKNLPGLSTLYVLIFTYRRKLKLGNLDKVFDP